MEKNYFNLKKVIAIAISLAALTMFSACGEKEPTDDPTSGTEQPGGTDNPNQICDCENGEMVLTSDMVKNGGNLPKCTYIVKGPLRINTGKTLTFAPGSIIKFDNDAQYRDRGYIAASGSAIVAKGTQQEPIIFTSNKATKAAGDWGYLIFKDGDFAYCTFEYGGMEGGGIMNEEPTNMILFTGTASFKHCTLRESVGTGLYVTGTLSAFEYNTITNCGENIEDAYPMFAGQSTVDRGIKRLEAMGQGNVINTAKGVRIAGGVSETTTLHKLNCPYLIFGLSVWGSGTKLTIEPGVHIKMGSGLGSSGLVDIADGGVLIAQGTASDPVVISGITESAGNWAGIYFATSRGAGCILEHCRITDGGYDGPDPGDAVVMVPGFAIDGYNTVTVRNCHIANSPTWGLYFTCNSNLSSTCSQSGNTFENCTVGNYPDCN